MDGSRRIRSGVAPGFSVDTAVRPRAHRGPAIPIPENVRKSLSPIAGDRGQPRARIGRRECIHGSVRAAPKQSSSNSWASLWTVPAVRDRLRSTAKLGTLLRSGCSGRTDRKSGPGNRPRPRWTGQRH